MDGLDAWIFQLLLVMYLWRAEERVLLVCNRNFPRIGMERNDYFLDQLEYAHGMVGKVR